MSNEKLDAAGVRQKFGVAPERIVDYLALTGDAVDNVPGVDKVGPKTAAKWIQQYGSLDAVMAHAGEIPGAVGENLRKALDWLPKGRELLTVKRDVALPVGLDDLHAKEADEAKLARLLRALRLQDHAARAPRRCARARAPRRRRRIARRRRSGRAGGTAQVPVRSPTRTLLGASLKRLERPPTWSASTPRPPAWSRCSRAWSACHSRSATVPAYLPLAHEYPGAPEQIGVDRALARAQALAGERAPPQGRAEPQVRRAHPRQPRRARCGGIAHDTLLESYVLEVHERHDLDSLSQRHLGWKTISYDEVTGKGAVAHLLRRGRDRARHRVRGRGCRLRARACTTVLFAKIADEER